MDTKVNNPAQMWQVTLGELELQMTKATYTMWLKDTQFLRLGDGSFVISVRNEAAVDWLTNRLKETVERTLSAVVGQATAVAFEFTAKSGNNGNGSHPKTANMPPPPDDPDRRPARPTEGYGGHLNGDDRAALLARIEERERLNGSHAPVGVELARANQSHKRGPKFHVPRQPRRKNGRGDQANIDVVERDPMRAHVETAHYAKRFWQPLLGVNAFALWELLRSYYYFVRYHGAEQPTITLLCDTLGWTDRRTLLGREATEKKAGQVGAIQVLEQFGILKHETKGEGQQTVHHFRRVLDDLPLLTPKQVAQLPKGKQVEHEVFLSFYDFDIDAWLEIAEESNVQEAAAKRVL